MIRVCTYEFMLTLDGRERLKQIMSRVLNGRTKASLAKDLGVSHTAVTRWCNGEVMPDTENLAAIGALVNMSLEEIRDYITGRPLTRPKEVFAIVNKIRSMPSDDFALIVKAVGERMAAIN